MNYDDCINYLFSRLPMFHRVGAAAYKPGIGNIVALCEMLGNPHRDLQFVHIAGTNGKGSTAHMIASALQESGYITGLHTSPHLVDFRERFRINGSMISREEIVDFVSTYRDQWEPIQPTFFEIGVALAFHAFKKVGVDICVLETGLGGRLDSTNIVTPLVTAITPIGMDHMNLLGDKLEAIAAEKAGIIKPGIPVVVSAQRKEALDVLVSRATEVNAPLISAEDGQPDVPFHPLAGNHQRTNARTAFAALQTLASLGFNIPLNAVSTGFANVVKNTGIRGRWEVIHHRPLTVCDVAHNEDGIAAVVAEIGATLYHNLHIVMGVVNDKDLDRMLIRLPANATYYFCQAKIPRAMDAAQLQFAGAQQGLIGGVYPTVEDALFAAMNEAGEGDLILVTGSFFTVAEVLALPSFNNEISG